MYINDERQFKTAKRPQAPINSDATVRKRFSAITSLYFVVDRISEFFYVCIYGNFQFS